MGTRKLSESLGHWQAGNTDVLAHMIPMLKQELRNHAKGTLNGSNDTLVAAELLNQVFLNMVEKRSFEWRLRREFFSTAARLLRETLMEQVVVQEQHAVRVKLAIDREEENKPYFLDLLHEGLERLAQEHARLAQIAELRFFGGLGMTEIARILAMPSATVAVEWGVARQYLTGYCTQD